MVTAGVLVGDRREPHRPLEEGSHGGHDDHQDRGRHQDLDEGETVVARGPTAQEHNAVVGARAVRP